MRYKTYTSYAFKFKHIIQLPIFTIQTGGFWVFLGRGLGGGGGGVIGAEVSTIRLPRPIQNTR